VSFRIEPPLRFNGDAHRGWAPTLVGRAFVGAGREGGGGEGGGGVVGMVGFFGGGVVL
jgi:hypothetical protein